MEVLNHCWLVMLMWTQGYELWIEKYFRVKTTWEEMPGFF